MHGGVRALTAAILLERGDQIAGVLAIQLRYAVGRIDVLVVVDAMAAKTGVRQHLAVGGIAGREGGRRSAKDQADEQDPKGAATRQRHTDSGFCGTKRAQSVRAETRFYHSMIALIQRVTAANVRIDDRLSGEIGPGLLALIGVVRGDDTARAERLLHRGLDYRGFAAVAG